MWTIKSDTKDVFQWNCVLFYSVCLCTFTIKFVNVHLVVVCLPQCYSVQKVDIVNGANYYSR